MWQVIVADDEPFVREALKEMIPWENMGYHLMAAFKNGKEVVNAVEDLKPDIVILDIQMPLMNGLETAKWNHEKYPDIIIVLLTAYEDFKYAQQAIVLQVKRYIIKSNLFEDLPKALEEISDELKKDNRLEKKRAEVFKDLLQESEYWDMTLEDKDEIKWMLENFQTFRIIVFKGCIGQRDTMDVQKYRMLQRVEKLFEGIPTKLVVSTCTTECAVLVSGDAIPDKKELIQKCGKFCAGEEENLLVGISEIYSEMSDISIAYRTVLNEMGRCLFDVEEKYPGVMYVEQKNKLNDNQLNKIICNIISGMQNGDENTCRKEMKKFCTLVRNYSDSQIRYAAILFIFECHRLYVEYGGEGTTEFDIEQEKAISTILETKKLSDIESYLEDLMMSYVRKKNEEMQTADELIYAINKFIDKNYVRKISLDLIADAVHANRCYISRIYKERTGEKLFDTINQKKIEAAKRYIEDGKMKIYEIADRTGWEDTAYFSRVFKKYTGYSPKEYEKLCRR